MNMQRFESGISMQRFKMVKVLRDLADNLEGAEMPFEITVFEHHENVSPLEFGDAIADVKWHGRSIVIHVGDLRRANHMALAKRLPSPNNQPATEGDV